MAAIHGEVRLALARFRSRRDILDLLRGSPVQDVFIKVLNKAKSYRGDGSFKAWLFNIARNTTFDTLRKAKHRGIPANEETIEPMDFRTTEQVFAGNQTLEGVSKALASLPPPTREIIWLGRFVFENYEEMGQALGCKTSAARVRMHRAMQQLNDAFTQINGAPIDV